MTGCRASLVMFLIAVIAAPANATPEPEPASGAFTGVVPIIPTGWKPTERDSTKGTYEAVGSSQWQGTWTGVTTYRARGTSDLNRGGAGSGVLDETFTGGAADGDTGTLSFRWTYVFEPDGRIRLDGRIVGGTGDFAAATGRVTADGFANAAYTVGALRGSWTH